MNEYIIYFLFLIIILNLLNFLFIKYNFLVDDKEKLFHKNFVNKDKVPITGGFLFLFFILYFYKITFFAKFLMLSIFVLGLLSDINKLSSPLKRLLIQSIIIISFIYIENIYVSELRLLYIDNIFLNNFFLKLIFTAICLLILINGSNFIDGVNTLCGGYFFILFLNIYLLSFDNQININLENIKILLLIFIIFLISNIFNKSFLGDGGSYLLGFFTGIFLINLSNNNSLLSPYYIAILLWYPVFENFFSFVRRSIYESKNIQDPDNLHLHHLLFISIKKFFFNDKYANIASGVIINLFNFNILRIASNYTNETKSLIMIITIYSFTYLATYFYLRKINKHLI